MKYYSYDWKNSPGGNRNAPVTSHCYYEVGDDHYVVRQIELYPSGAVLFYDPSHWADQYGRLSDLPIKEAPGLVAISKDEFETIWQSNKPTNR